VTADRLLTVEEARERVFAAIAGPTESEVAWLSEGLGRVAAEHITSPIALPPWDNSAMDGYGSGPRTPQRPRTTRRSSWR
jgi:molybdopterin molybdotransferase